MSTAEDFLKMPPAKGSAADFLSGGTGLAPAEGEYTQPYEEKALSQQEANIRAGIKNTKPVETLAVKVKKGMSFDEVARAYNYDPALLRQSAWYERLGGERMFDNMIDEEAAGKPIPLTQVPKNIARSAGRTVEGVEQFTEHMINKGAGNYYAPTVALHDLISKVRDSNWEHNVNKGAHLNEKGQETFFNENRIGEMAIPMGPLGTGRKAKAAVQATEAIPATATAAAKAAQRYQPAVEAAGPLRSAAQQGAVGGATSVQTAASPDVGGKSDDYGGTALGRGIIGSALGPTIAGAAKVGAGTVGKMVNMRPEYFGKQMGRDVSDAKTRPRVDTANRLDTPYRLGDMYPRNTKLVGLENYITPSDDIAKTQDAARSAAESRVAAAQEAMTSEGWGDLSSIERAATNPKGPKNKRHDAAVELLDILHNPSTDWSENLAASARLEILKANIKADSKYARVDSVGATVKNVPTTKYRQELLDIVKEREASSARTKRNAMTGQREPGNNPYLDYIEELQKKQGEMYRDFAAARKSRRDLNDEMAIAKTKAGAGTETEVIEDFERLRAARLYDMKQAAYRDRKPYLADSLEKADAVYADTVKVRESILAKELEKRPELADEVLPVFLRSQLGSGHDRGTALHKALGPRGREAVKFALLDNELRNSVDLKGHFSPDDFAAGLQDKSALLNPFLNNTERQELEGMKKFFAHLDRVGYGLQTKNAEMMARSGLGAGGVAAKQGDPIPSGMMAVVGQAFGSVGAARLINSPRMQRFWLASSDLVPGSKAMDALGVEITNALAREVGRKGGEATTDKVTRRK